jgi:hypothetical protein
MFKANCTPKIGICIHSFDGYQRFWKSMVHFSKENLPNEIPVYLFSETNPISENYGKIVKTGKGSFVKRFLKGLNQLPSDLDYIIYLQEDMWITEKIKKDSIDEMVKVMIHCNLICVKLGEGSYLKDELQSLEKLSKITVEHENTNLYWYGDRSWGMSHHISIFRLDYLKMSLRLALLFNKTSPIDHETFTSRTLSGKIKSEKSGKQQFGIGVGDPNQDICIKYVHASSAGELTTEAKNLLIKKDILNYYDESIKGDIFPSRLNR